MYQGLFVKKILVLVVCSLVVSASQAETTIFQAPGAINFNGNDNVLFVRGDQKWGASGCPDATYVQVKSDVVGRKDILSIVLAAKMSSKRVQFWGGCDANTDYFNAFYIVVE
jgi:hypothetical protein